jgi:anti-sigma factor RsiW
MTVTETMLLAYVDGELDAAGVAEVEALVAADPQARRTVEMYRDTASLLRAACGEAVYAPGVARLLPPPSPLHAWTRRRFAWAAAVFLTLGAAAGSGATWLGTQPSAMATLIDEIAEYHAIYSRESAHLAEVPAARAEELASWLGERLQRRLDIPDLAADGLRFAGGRMLVIDGEPVAQFMYTRAHGLPVAVCIARMEGAPRPLTMARRGALRVAAWRQDGYAYVVVGEMPAEFARAVAERVRAQLRT